MKTVISKKSSSKGFSKLLLIILIPVGLFILIFLFNFVKTFFFTGIPSNTPIQSQSESGFGKVEDTAYIFYYPKDYVKGELGQSDRGEKDVLNYKNPNTKAIVPESLFLRIDKGDQKLSEPTYELCKNLSEGYREKAKDEIEAELVHGGFGNGKGVGCKVMVKSSITGVNDATVIVVKFLWDPKEPYGTIYKAKAVYYANASKDQAQRLELAIDQFSLK